MNQSSLPITRQSGFTLIELSIVLVIIGLIIGGVLVGQDLIKAAEIRSTIGQIEKYNTAVNTFRSKFNGFPGDLAAAQAASFGLTTRNGGTGRGDGNNLIEGSAAAGALPCAETVLFFTDLSSANLIDGAFVGADGSVAGTSCTTAASAGAVATLVPVAKLGHGNNIYVYAASGINYFHLLAGVTAISNAGALTGAAFGITPSEAYQMDSKVDDGKPLTGIVLARAASLAALAADTAQPAADGVCVSDATGSPYNTDAANGGTSKACSLQFRMNY